MLSKLKSFQMYAIYYTENFIMLTAIKEHLFSSKKTSSDALFTSFDSIKSKIISNCQQYKWVLIFHKKHLSLNI